MKPRKVNVSIGSCQHSLFKQHLFIVKRNFARGPVELFDVRMREVYCTVPRLTLALSESAHTKQLKRTVWSLLHRKKYCSYNSYITVCSVCLVGMG